MNRESEECPYTTYQVIQQAWAGVEEEMSAIVGGWHKAISGYPGGDGLWDPLEVYTGGYPMPAFAGSRISLLVLIFSGLAHPPHPCL